MRVLHTIAGLRAHLAHHASSQIGLVPTMGALHQGHDGLIRRARNLCDLVVVSIFVNPCQFAPGEDLAQYPRDWEGDRQRCEALGVDVVFAPTAAEIYGPEPMAITQVQPPESMVAVLCGPHRPGHFAAVATIVVKLLEIVRPQVAFFGEKDAQQLAIVRRVVQDLNLPVTIQGVPVVREDSGLALSSRNQYLKGAEKTQGQALFHSLQQAATQFHQGERHSAALIHTVRQALGDRHLTPQYVEVVHPHTLAPLETIDREGLLAIAVMVGRTRLIDNIHLSTRQPMIAIDGPAGAGKSTVTKRLAEKLGLLYLDTGAMYRAITWLVLENAIDPDDGVAIAEVMSGAQLGLHPQDNGPLKVTMNGQDITTAIRTPRITGQVSRVAAQGVVRESLVAQQQRIGHGGGLVAEGRDLGTKVFPGAECKIFLTATVAERARRRLLDLQALGETAVDLAQLEADIAERDRLDSTRALSPLKKAVDAVEIVTDGLTIEEVVDRIIALYQEKAPNP